MKREERAKEVWRRLRRAYPDAACALVHRNPYELLVATILSAQCTDDRVNKVTPGFFRRYPDPKRLAEAKLEEVEESIRSTGFFRNKARSLVGAAKRIVEEHGGTVPDTMEELLELPGVARKTANVVLGNAFGRNEGVVVDTHVHRLARRIGLASGNDATAIERDLMRLYPRRDWTLLSHLLIHHGRAVCASRKPRCEDCVLGPDLCRSYGKPADSWKGGSPASRKPSKRG